jgi:hypothetical protein
MLEKTIQEHTLSLFTNFSKLQTLKVLQHLPLINKGFTTSEMTLPFTGFKHVPFVKYFAGAYKQNILFLG